MNNHFVKKIGLGAAAALSTAAANAAIPTEATGAITTMTTDGGDMVLAFWPVLIAITGGLVLMKVFKKALSRAS